MSEKRYRGEEDLSIDSIARPMQVPGRMPASAKLFPGALLRKARDGRDANGVASGAEDAVAKASSSTGSALPSDVQSKFEGSLGADLSGVRVHTGAVSAEAASSVGARAYTVGSDIHFADGQYAPTDPFGLHLLAHEVAHTQQQSGGSPYRQHKLEVSSPGDAAEVEADRAADAMVGGASFALGGRPSLIAREPEGAAAEKSGGGPAKEGEKGGVHLGEMSGSIPLPKKKLPGKGKIGPFEIEGEVTGKIVYKKGKQAGDGQSHLSGPPGIGDPAAPKKEEAGPAVDVEKDKMGVEVELHDKFGGGGFFQPEWNGKADIKKDHIGLQGGFKLEHEWAGHKGDPVKLSLESIQLKVLDLDKGEFTPIALSTGAELTVPAFDYTSAKGYHLDVSIVGSVEISLTPDWKEIAEKVGKELLKKGATAAAEDATLTTGAGAAGADLAFAAGLMTIPASMVFAWKKAIDLAADMKGSAEAGRARVQEIADAAMQGLLAGATSDPIAGTVHDQFNNLCHHRYDDLVKAKKDGGMTIEEYLGEAAKGVKENAEANRKMFVSQVGPVVAEYVAQTYYDRHRGDLASDESKLNDAQEVYSNICGGSRTAFHPGAPGSGKSDVQIKLNDHNRKAGEDPNAWRDEQKQGLHDEYQQKIEAARARAYADGNRLAAWIQTDKNLAAVNAHNDGSAHLKYADGVKAQIKTPDDVAGFGLDAVNSYNAAIDSFGTGLALYPPGWPSSK